MNLIKVGHTLKPHGLKGDIKIRFERDFNEDIDALFVTQKGEKVPYFIENIKGSYPEFIFKLEDVDTPESAKKLSSSEVYLKEEDVIEEDEHLDLTGFDVYDGESFLGKVVRVEEFPAQNMLIVINVDNEEIMIPEVEDFFVEIDEENNKIFMELPEGLY